MTKAERIKEYNKQYPDYAITAIKKIDGEYLDYYMNNGNKSIFEAYDKPSDEKIISYKKILEIYKPMFIFNVAGSTWSYSVLLRADNGDILHITKNNNYLIELV